MFNPGELPLVLLALAEHGPMKAYEFIAELERLFAPEYQASPGGVYPALRALTDERLLKTETEGRGKRYALTASGFEALDRRRRQLAAIEERTGARLRAGQSLAPLLDRFCDRVMKLSGLIDPECAEAVLEKAVSELKNIGGFDAEVE